MERRAFNKTCDVFAVVTLVFTLVYLVANVLPDAKRLKDEGQEQLRAMSFDLISGRSITTLHNIDYQSPNYKPQIKIE